MRHHSLLECVLEACRRVFACWHHPLAGAVSHFLIGILKTLLPLELVSLVADHSVFLYICVHIGDLTSPRDLPSLTNDLPVINSIIYIIIYIGWTFI